MRENVRIALGRAGCAFLAGLGLALAPLASAEGAPLPKAPADPHAGPTCSAGSSTPEVKVWVDQAQRDAAQAAKDDPSAPVVLNGNGHNYGSGNPTLDDGALQFESREAR